MLPYTSGMVEGGVLSSNAVVLLTVLSLVLNKKRHQLCGRLLRGEVQHRLLMRGRVLLTPQLQV